MTLAPKKLPPWSGDHVAMLRWLGQKLSAEIDAKLGGLPIVPRKATPLEGALLAASRGDVEQLRGYLVELTSNADVGRFVNLPKLTRGKQWKPSRKRKKAVQPPEIAKWAIRIREIWNRYYGPKQRRSPDWTAEDFAFAIFMIDAGVKGYNLTERELHSDETRWTDRAHDQINRGKKRPK